jgi:hypothetical protein
MIVAIWAGASGVEIKLTCPLLSHDGTVQPPPPPEEATMKTTDKSYPVGLANLLAGKPATTTTKETKVSTTTKARKHTTKPVAVEVPAEVVEVKATPADLTALAVAEAIKSEGAVADAKVALRSACIAVFNANEAGVSFRQLELASKTAGAKIGKSTYARYAKAGAILIKDESLDALEVLAKINKAEKGEAKKAEAVKAEAKTESAESDADSTDEPVVALTVDQIVEQLTENGAEAIADVTANLIASLQDDHAVFATLAVALLEASANTAPLDATDLKSTLLACANTVAFSL